MASGDVVMQVTGTYVYGDSSVKTGTTIDQSTTFQSSGGTLSNGVPFKNAVVTAQQTGASSGGCKETVFDGAKTYTITISET